MGEWSQAPERYGAEVAGSGAKARVESVGLKCSRQSGIGTVGDAIGQEICERMRVCKAVT